MSQLHHVITIRLDETTLARIRGRTGQGFRVKSVSQLIREGIQLRLAQPDEYTGWQANRTPGQRSGM